MKWSKQKSDSFHRHTSAMINAASRNTKLNYESQFPESVKSGEDSKINKEKIPVGQVLFHLWSFRHPSSEVESHSESYQPWYR